MRFECDNCHAKYKISDQKVVGRVVRFPCRKCDNKILIDGRSDDVTVPAGTAYGFEDVTRRSEPAPFGMEPATARRRPVSSG
ncbi:MAG: zinc-ribbon domain-containing protein, partial [Polyangiales bacterium]